MELCQQLVADIQKRYATPEYPAQRVQWNTWETSKPLDNLRILDATPLFFNTLVKHVALLKAGAKLTVATSDSIPWDPQVRAYLEKLGASLVHDAKADVPVDIVLDCGGVHAHLKPTIGFVELTRSGAYHFQHADKPVILVDDSRIKTIETCLGTGDGFHRGMIQAGYGHLKDKTIVVFGCGKVGRGIAFYAHRNGAKVIGVDSSQNVRLQPGIPLIPLQDMPQVLDAVRSAWCVVSATGYANALDIPQLTSELLRGKQLIVNMGVEDEWGPSLPPERAVNRKQPLNFILDEPTQIKYIDPTMALDNLAAAILAHRPGPPGIRKVAPEDEQAVWKDVEAYGLIAPELAEAGL